MTTQREGMRKLRAISDAEVIQLAKEMNAEVVLRMRKKLERRKKEELASNPHLHHYLWGQGLYLP